MENKTSRRNFLKATVGALGLIPVLSSCIAPRVSETARQKDGGDPWRSDNCGHLTRSKDDISGDRCPRCYSKQLKRVTEEQFTDFLKKEAAAK